MNIPVAIHVLDDILRYVMPGDPPEEHQAIALSIHALKAVQFVRTGNTARAMHPFPGETSE